MKNISLLLLLFALCFASCRKEIDSMEVETKETPPIVYIESALRGQVVNENGDPLPNATVSVENEIILSDENGNFHLTKVRIKKSGSMVKSNIDGFFNASSHTNFSADGGSYVVLTMIEKGTAEMIQANENNSFTNDQGVKISIPPNSIVDENGNAYNGQVAVYSRHLDPTDENLGAIMPGDLIASDEDGNPLALETFGMVALELESPDGEELEIKTESEIMLEIPIPASLVDEAPDEIDLWLFDLEEEEWLLKGVCNKINGSYHCAVPTTGFWNCDVSMPAICLSGQFFNSDSTFAAYLQVIVEDLSNNFIYWGYTDSLGYFCGSVPQGTNLRLTVKDLCDNIVYTEDIGPYSQDFELGAIYLDEVVSEFIINISGIIHHCLTNDVPDGHLAVRYPGKIRIYPFQGAGYDIDMGLKCVSFPTLEISTYSNTQENRTETSLHSDFEDIDLGDQPTCDTLSDFFRLEIAGFSYWTAPTQWYFENNTTTNWLVLEGLSAAGTFKLDLQTYDGIGTYDSNAFLTVENESGFFPDYPVISASSPDFTVEITLDDGTYIEGTLSGEVPNQAGAMVAASGSFRIRIAP